MNRRVVVTGLGVVAPNGTGIASFLHAIQNGLTGLKFMPRFKELNFLCQVVGQPDFEWDCLKDYVPEVTFHGLRGISIGYAIKAAADAWTDAGNLLENAGTLWNTGCVFGNSVSDTEINKSVISRVDSATSRKLGSRVVEQLMNSGPAAYVSGLLGLGNKIVSNSTACATGSQAVLMGYEYIKYGMADRMLVGSTEHLDPYIFGAFDAMRILSRKFNDAPEKASRPMSASAGGFVPGSGAGALVLEDLEFALQRNARIYAEILGGASNSGGQRDGGSMTAPNPEGIIRCIRQALNNTGVSADKIDLISGHLTATGADKLEIENWAKGLGLKNGQFPPVNSLKSMIGHCLSAAGSIEIVAVILQIVYGFIHPNINLEDPNPAIEAITGNAALPVTRVEKDINVAVKANFGFGDVNTCLFFSKYKNNG